MRKYHIIIKKNHITGNKNKNKSITLLDGTTTVVITCKKCQLRGNVPTWLSNQKKIENNIIKYKSRNQSSYFIFNTYFFFGNMCLFCPCPHVYYRIRATSGLVTGPTKGLKSHTQSFNFLPYLVQFSFSSWEIELKPIEMIRFIPNLQVGRVFNFLISFDKVFYGQNRNVGIARWPVNAAAGYGWV